METSTKGVEFDPGFAPHVLAFQGSLDFLYKDISKYKNFSQKQMRFRQYYKKILSLLDNNIGFFIGCLMWAGYIKTLPQQEIIGNHCFGKEYNEEFNKSETQYLLQFISLFPKDMKYYLGETFEFTPDYKKILELYEEFTCINKGFTASKYNTDILLPTELKLNNCVEYKEIIEKVIAEKDLSKLREHISEIL